MPDQTPFSRGTLLNNGRFKILTVLNKGSYGTVYLARDLSREKRSHRNIERCAIKCVTNVEEAEHEIAIHKLLGKQRNISHLRCHFEENGCIFLVMEYYSGGDLYEAISAARGPHESNAVYEFMMALIRAVEYAHSRGVYHRDIKPENILIGSGSKASSVVLADWGLATQSKNCSEFGVGSERYMAPEIFDKEHSNSYDAEKADIWSIGICLLNVLFGRNPFQVASHMDRLYLDFATNREALFDIFPTLSHDTFQVLRHCLTIDPDNRSLARTKEALKKVTVWTTDGLYYDDVDDVEAGYDEDFEEDVEEGELAEENMGGLGASLGVGSGSFAGSFAESYSDVFTATANRQPLECPSVRGQTIRAAKHFENSWARKLQFTPKESRFVFGSSGPKTGHMSRPSAGNSSRLAAVMSNDHLDTLDSFDTKGGGDQFSSESDRDDMRFDIMDDSDIFPMDNDLSGQFQKLDIASSRDDKLGSGAGGANPLATNESTRSNTDSSSISNVPSLTLSATDTSQASTPYMSVYPSMAKSVPNRDAFKFGKSWGDMALDDDDDDDDLGDVLEFARSLPRYEIKQR